MCSEGADDAGSVADCDFDGDEGESAAIDEVQAKKSLGSSLQGQHCCRFALGFAEEAATLQTRVNADLRRCVNVKLTNQCWIGDKSPVLSRAHQERATQRQTVVECESVRAVAWIGVCYLKKLNGSPVLARRPASVLQ